MSLSHADLQWFEYMTFSLHSCHSFAVLKEQHVNALCASVAHVKHKVNTQ